MAQEDVIQDRDADRGVLLGQAARGELSVADLLAEADRLGTRGERDAAAMLYRTWLAHNAAHPVCYAARFNFAVLLAAEGEYGQARDMLRAAIAQKPDFAPAFINLGTVLERAGDRVGAVGTWQELASLLPQITGEAIGHKTTALNQAARVLEGAKIEAAAEASMRASLEIDPGQSEVIQHYVALRQAQCEWPVLQDLPRLSAHAQLEAMSPLSLAAQFDDPVLQLAAAQRYSERDAVPAGIGTAGQWPPPERATQGRLRIGYVSSDFREHAVGFLTAELFELHDRKRFESFAYYCGPARDDACKQRFRQSAEHWRDIAGMTDKQAAACIVRDGIDILIDLNLYTKDGRIKMFAYRPAPVIVNWLGFPGSAGSAHHHYIIADRTIIPPEDEIFYSERVLRLPCYQPNDRQRIVAEATPGREEAGLPDGAFVFCSFNGAHKIVPEVFSIWMDILRAVPHGVLWLLSGEAETMARLRRQAESSGIDPARLIFAPRMDNAAHLARYRVADLFLDTAPYGAHTTASDALWLGLPVLTRAGNGFSARVCASLVRSAGLPDFVCATHDEYRSRAVALAHDPAAMRDARARLAAQRDSCTLFDTPGLVRALEGLFERMWQDYCAGALPRPALRHLPFYHQLGCERHGLGALPERDALLSWYRNALAHRDAMQPMPPDTLLWRGEGGDADRPYKLAA